MAAVTMHFPGAYEGPNDKGSLRTALTFYRPGSVGRVSGGFVCGADASWYPDACVG